MKYSILIPAYKAKFFYECLDSALNQSFKDYEVIILNDASPEDLDSIVGAFHDNRIRYYKNEVNVGAINVVDNWNTLLSLAKGDFVACIGDDDKLSPNFLEAYNSLIEKHPDLDVYHARTEIIGENSEFLDLQPDRPERESVYAMLWNNVCSDRLQFIGDFLFRTATLRQKGGFYKLPLAWISDCISALIVAKDKGSANLHYPTFFYRSNSLSITSSKHINLKIEAMLRFGDWVRFFLKETPLDGLDAKYRILIAKGINHRVLHDIRFMLADDLKNNWNVLYWLRHRKKYQISLSNIFVSFVLAIGLKFMK